MLVAGGPQHPAVGGDHLSGDEPEMRAESAAPGDLAAGHVRMARSDHLGCVRRAGTYCRSLAQIGHAFGVAPAPRRR